MSSRHWSLVVSLILIAAPARADLRFARTTIDLGEIKGGLAAEIAFDFTVDGKEPLEIVEVRPGCGCLTPTFERLKYVPGDKGRFGLRLRTLGQQDGPRSWQTRLRTRQGDKIVEASVWVTARIVNDVSVEPAVVALHVENALRQEISVTDRRTPASLRVTAVHASLPALKAAIVPDGGGVTRIVLEVAAKDLAPGRHDVSLDILTDDPLYRHLQVPVTLTRGGRQTVTVSPDSVHIAKSPDRPVNVQIVRLRPTGDEKIVAAVAEADDVGITCTLAAGPGTGATLRVQVDTRRLTRAGAHVVRVRLTEPAAEMVTIPVIVD